MGTGSAVEMVYGDGVSGSFSKLNEPLTPSP